MCYQTLQMVHLNAKSTAFPPRGGLVLLVNYWCFKNSAALNNKHLLISSFCKSEIQEWLSNIVLAQDLTKGCNWDVIRASVIWRLDWGWRVCYQDITCVTIGLRTQVNSGSWQEVLDLREQDENNSVFYDLISEVTLHHLYNILVITYVSPI